MQEVIKELNVVEFASIGDVRVFESVIFSLIVVVVLTILSIWLGSGLKVHNPGKKQAAAEFIVTWLDKFTANTLGKNGKQYGTYLEVVLCFIGLSNILSVIGLGLKPPTKDMMVPAALAIMSIILIEGSNIRQRGVGGWLKSKTQPSAVMTPINFLEIGIRPLSLCMRLFGNVLGAFVIMKLLEAIPLPLLGSIPFVGPVLTVIWHALLGGVAGLYFEFFDGFLQAYIFVFLTSLFIKEAVETEEE